MNDFTKQVIREGSRGMISAWWLLPLIPLALIGFGVVVIVFLTWAFNGKFHFFG